MNYITKKDVISVLTDAIEILKVKDEGDVAELTKLSNRTIHDASIFQDEMSVSIAILIYSLAKVIARKHDEEGNAMFVRLLEGARKSLQEENIAEYDKSINNLFKAIAGIDSKLRMYVSEVISQAQIKKASKIYEHGISLARTAEILGVSQWELMNYVGKTMISEEEEGISSADKRLKFARGLFN